MTGHFLFIQVTLSYEFHVLKKLTSKISLKKVASSTHTLTFTFHLRLLILSLAT